MTHDKTKHSEIVQRLNIITKDRDRLLEQRAELLEVLHRLGRTSPSAFGNDWNRYADWVAKFVSDAIAKALGSDNAPTKAKGEE